MEPQDNDQIGLRKAISAHEMAEAALDDLAKSPGSGDYAVMVERIRQNLLELRAESERIAV